MRRFPHRALFLSCIGSVLAATGAVGQTVVGSVVEDGTLQPLPGAFVILEDEAGARRAAVLAGEEGRFVLRAPAPGRYRLVAQLIGYADAAGGYLELAEGETVERRLEVAVRAISLEGIRAEVDTRCHARPDRELRTDRVWEEARKALEITAWAEEEGALRYQLIKRRRELDAATLRVMAIEEAGRQAYYEGSPYRSVPAETLHVGGYVQATPAGEWDHFAPDAEVLLSDSFLDTHCFRARTGDDPKLVGLAFEPVPGRELPEIEGVLWLDRGTAELRHLEYTYVNLPYPHGDWPQVGGRVEFERLSTGIWIVRRWHIRMPLAAVWTGGFGGDRRELALRSLSEEGAVVSRVRTRTGEVLAEAMGATVYGTVEDSTSGRALSGAIVELVPTGRTTTTGPDGLYRMSGLPAGAFQLQVSHPELELLGAAPPTLDVTLEPGRAARLPVRPSLSALALELCARAGSFQDPVVLYGAVLDPADETPVPGAVVRIFGAGPERRVTTDSVGGYATCLERSESAAVELAAAGPADLFRDRHALERLEVEPVEGTLARADLTLPKEAMTPRLASERGPNRGRRWSNAMIGTVVGADDDAPIAGAMVLIRTTDGSPVYSAVTNEEGQFRFMHPDQMTKEWSLSVEHVAYGKVSRVVTFRPGEQLDVEVLLADRVIGLDPIVVTERRRGLLADMGFYDRLERGFGEFIERDEIERRAPSRVTDLMQGRSGLRVVQTDPFKYDIRLLGTARFSGDCQPSIWVDGSLARDSGEPRVDTVRGHTIYRQVQLSEVVSPEEIEAIELYTGAAGLPIQYGGSNAACGVVLIWTRRGR